jgi:hypothetical protein
MAKLLERLATLRHPTPCPPTLAGLGPALRWAVRDNLRQLLNLLAAYKRDRLEALGTPDRLLGLLRRDRRSR